MDIVIFKGKNGQWNFHFKSFNGKIVANGTGYNNERNAIAGARSIQKRAASAKIVRVKGT